MSTNEHDIGDVITLRATFRDAAGALANPGAVALAVRKPDGTLVTPAPTPTEASVGVWQHAIAPDQSGWWTYRFIGTGANAAAEEARFFVRTPRV